jgi:hypothetical protein
MVFHDRGERYSNVRPLLLIRKSLLLQVSEDFPHLLFLVLRKMQKDILGRRH